MTKTPNKITKIKISDFTVHGHRYTLCLVTVFEEGINLGTIFHRRSKPLLIKYA
jgi:hypothetical protein